MAKLFTQSYIRPVYYLMRKSDTDGKNLYQRAPFDVVVINGNVHVQPRSIGGSDAALAVLNYASAEDVALWRQDLGGYETLEPIVIDECQMGDMSDNWMGLNAVSNF